MAQLSVADKGIVNHVGEVHDCPQQSCGAEVHCLEVAKSDGQDRSGRLILRGLKLPQHA